MFCTFCAIISPEWTHSCQGSGDWKVVATSGHLTLGRPSPDLRRFRANGSHQLNEADPVNRAACLGIVVRRRRDDRLFAVYEQVCYNPCELRFISSLS